ncbi:MAG: hypothetical protein HGB18_02650 [Candidatus Moranbacteria bacterium]|nr:hypothetical protein [Candidatus Moranbacteria bacterium]
MKEISFSPDRKRFLQTAAFVFGTLLLYGFFPQESRLNPTVQSVLLGVILFLALPFLYGRFILRQPLSSLGFRAPSRPYGALAVPLVAIPTVALWFVLLSTFHVERASMLPSAVRASFMFFVLYEVVLVGAIAFLYDVFFRGLVQIVWLRGYGIWAALAQAGLFVALLGFSAGGIGWTDAPLVLASVASGLVAAYTGTVPTAWMTSWLVLFLSDIITLVVR